MSSLSSRRSTRRRQQAVPINEDEKINEDNDSTVPDVQEEEEDAPDDEADLDMNDDGSVSAVTTQPNESVVITNRDTSHNSNNNGLFGNPSTPSTLLNVPKLESADAATFADWRMKFKGYCLMQGIREVVFKPYSEALELSITMDNNNRPTRLIVQLLKSLHAKAYGAITLAVEKVSGS